MNYEEKIKELEGRIETLENIEKVKDLGGVSERAKEGKDYIKDKWDSWTNKNEE